MNNPLPLHVVAALLGVAFTARFHSAPLNPLNFASLGALALSNGSFTRDTDALEIRQGTNAGSQYDQLNVRNNITFGGTLDVGLINWVPVSTNPFDAHGNFLLTNPSNPGRPQESYRLQLQ